jgi:hypothetical protein
VTKGSAGVARSVASPQSHCRAPTTAMRLLQLPMRMPVSTRVVGRPCGACALPSSSTSTNGLCGAKSTS